ncbi:MAG: VWA domain-containing protein [Desulfofundulus sp.]
MHRAFEGRARHYVFVSAVDDVTAYFEEPDLERCLAGISRAGIDFRGYSDYGAMFRMFAEEYASHVDSDTVVLVLGDARNNRRADGRDVLARLNSRARAVIWLNPEDPAKWNQGDSIIGVYRRCVSRVVDISTFGRLLDFLTGLPEMVLAG